MHVILKMEGEPAIPMSFERFAQENDLTGEWRDEILGAIDIHGVFQGGGGAQPAYTVTKDTRSLLERINAVPWIELRVASEKPTLDAALKHIMDIAGIETGDVAGQMVKVGWPCWRTSLRLQWLFQWLETEQQAAFQWLEAEQQPKGRYGVWCMVSGGVTGPREAWLKTVDGEVHRFSTLAEAVDEADRLRDQSRSWNSSCLFHYAAREFAYPGAEVA